GKDGTEEFEAETSPILDAGGARLGAPGPAKQLGRHDSGKPSSPSQRVSNQGPAAPLSLLAPVGEPSIESICRSRRDGTGGRIPCDSCGARWSSESPPMTPASPWRPSSRSLASTS